MASLWLEGPCSSGGRAGVGVRAVMLTEASSTRVSGYRTETLAAGL
jgi:hypothetical protein